MAKTKAKSAAPYVQRLLEDEYVHDQLMNAAERLRDAYGRVSSKKAKAADDKRFYNQVREAAGSLRNAANAIQRKPPPRRRGRKVLIVTGVAGAAAAATVAASKAAKGGQES
ncbi:MAG TPA: hypothetical protein VFL87_00735 [Thermoleophilaceae bacterium]|nr:hypothetical protein [Thermoleophilaceae bacterium]